MNLFFQQFIIALLLVLQGFSPLVHAHVEADHSETGLHIEGLLPTVDSQQHSAMQAAGHADTVIGMCSAIQQKNLLLKSMQDQDVDNNNFCSVSNVYVTHQIPVAQPEWLGIHAISFSELAPRAPPFQ